MRNFRKAIATLSVVAILSSLVVSTAFAGTFGDVPADAYYYNAVETLASEGIIDASKTSFDPARQLQRQEAAKLIVESAGLVADLPEVASFTDVPKTLWSFESVETAKANGVVSGYTDANGALTGKFGPTDTVTRAQFAKMIVEAFDLPMFTPDSPTFPDVTDTNAWYYEYVETAAHHGVVKGFADGSFGANKQIVRQDGAVMIYRALGMEVDPDDDVTPPEEPGDIDISLGDTPASSVVPKNATRVPFLAMDVDGEGTIKSMTFERFGAGSPSDFTNVYLYEGETRLTTGRSINSSTHKVTFTGLNYAVDGMSELTLVVDMNGTSGNVNGFRLYEVTSDDNVSFGEVEGELMSISNATVGSLTVEATGSLSNPKVAESDVKVAEFRLQAGSSEAVDLYGITLYQVGNISRSNLTNFVLTQGGTEVASVDAINSNDNIVLIFDTPYELAKGDSRNFELYADVGSGARAGDTVRIYLDNASDINSVGSTYGYGVSVTRTLYDNNDTVTPGSDASWTTIEGGQVTISFMGPSVQDYATNSRDVELMRFNVVAQNNVEVRNTTVKITAGGALGAVNGLWNATGSSANYTDIKLVDVDSGEVLAGPFDVTNAVVEAGDVLDTVDVKLLTDIWNLEAGVSRTLAFTADVANFAPAANETVKVDLVAFGASDIKNLENNLYIAASEIVPSGNITGNSHNVKAGTTTISVAGVPALQTYINGSSNLPMTGVILSAGQGKDVYLKSLTVTAEGSADGDADTTNDCSIETTCVLTVSLWDGETQLGTTKSLSGTTATFNNLNLKVSKGTSKTLLLKTSLNRLSSVEAGVTLRLKVNASSDVTVQDSDGNSISGVDLTGTAVGPSHKINNSGTLSVSLEPEEANETDSRVVVAGTAGVTLAKYKFTAKDESLKLSKIRIEIPATAVEEVSNLYLYDGSTLVSGPVSPDSGGLANFNTFTSDFVVTKDSNKVLTVKADLNTISGGAVSSTRITATLSASNFEARSATGSNTVLTNADPDGVGVLPNTLPQVGREVVLRKSALTISRINVSNTNILGTSELYKFNVAVTPGETAYLKQLTFDVTDNTAGGVVFSDFKLYKNGVVVADGTPAVVTGPTDVVQNIVGSVVTLSWRAGTAGSLNELAISGASNEFSLEATVTGVIASNDSISTKMLMDTALVSLAPLGVVDAGAITGLTNVPETDLFLWSDGSDTLHSGVNGGPSTTDWTNGWLLKSLSLGTQTLLRP